MFVTRETSIPLRSSSPAQSDATVLVAAAPAKTREGRQGQQPGSQLTMTAERSPKEVNRAAWIAVPDSKTMDTYTWLSVYGR